MTKHHVRRQTQLIPYVLDDRLGHSLQLREVPQPTARLQHHHQGQQVARSPYPLPNPLQVIRRRGFESVNARIRRAARARGHFPNEQAALKCVYMAIMSLDPTGRGQTRWTMRWKTALNAFGITFDGRLSAARQ
jgi:transposase-like protein